MSQFCGVLNAPFILPSLRRGFYEEGELRKAIWWRFWREWYNLR